MKDMITETLKALCRCSPAIKHKILVTYYNFLARRFPDSQWTFMNYGFDDGTSICEVSRSADATGEWLCAQLYRHVAGAVSIEGRDVLEIGCGRGGGCDYVRRRLGAGQVTGLDFSSANIALCRKRYNDVGMNFVEGDAMHPPFDDASFDAVLNIESSHCYPSLSLFLQEVRRILRAGGHLLHADMRPANAMPALIDDMHSCGMSVVEESDISAQVVKALEHDSRRKELMIEQSVPRWLRRSFREFSAVKGSDNYARFTRGEMLYRRFVLRKTPEDKTPNGGRHS